MTDPTRRGFLSWVFAGAAAGLGSMMGIPFAGFVMAPLFRKTERQWIEVDDLSALRPGVPEARRLEFSTRTGFRIAQRAWNVWIWIENGEPIVLSSECTHLGCNVIWRAREGAFGCPCHGGKFDRQGRVISGPPPAPLPALPTKIREGKLFVQV